MDVVTLGQAKLAADRRYTFGLGCRFGFLGDSLTAGAVSGNTQGWAWPVGLSFVSGGVIRPVLIDGFPGQRSDQILPHLPEIVAAGVQSCVVAYGTNDILQSVALSVPQGNIKTAVQQLRSAGIQPVLATLPPNNGSYKTQIATLNAWIKRYATVNRIPVLDFFTTLVDPSTGNYLAGYYNDGTHPNAAGYLAMAQTAWTTLSPLVHPSTPLLTQINSDPINRLNSNSCFMTDANADGIPDGWTAYGGGGSGFTHSIVTGDSAITGNWAQIACSGTTGDRVLEYNANTSIVPGNKILVAGRVGVSAYTSGNGATVKVTFTGGSATAYPAYQIKAVASGPFYQELTVPTGTTAILFDLIAGAGTGTYKFAQPTIYDLTALGLTNL